MFLALARWLRRMPSPRVSRDGAIRLATAEMLRHGWNRQPSAPVIECLREWVIYGVDAMPCGNIVVYVDKQSGAVRTFTEEGRLT